MGQVIDFQQRRPRDGEAAVKPRPTPASWPPSGPAYVEFLLEPSLTLWRSMIASYAGLWFAPLGLEVRVAERPDQPATRTRVTSGG